MDLDPSSPRILWGSPLPPARSGVADYAVELLPELARLARVRVLRPPDWQPPSSWPAGIELVATETAAEPDEVELLHLGNNPHHVWLDRRLSGSRAVVVLHDPVLHHLLVEATLGQDDPRAFEDRLVAAHGPASAALAAARRSGRHGRLDPFLLPARAAFLAGASGVIVHSDWALEQVRRELPDLPAARVGLAVANPDPIDRTVARAEIGIGSGEVLLMHLGFLTPEKGLEAITTGVAAAVRAGTEVRLVVVGEGHGGERLRAAAIRVGIEDRIVLTGWIDPDSLPGLPAAADLGVVYRTPSAGETSAAALRFFACGVPVAIGGTRQFLEWPDAAAPRLTPGPPAAAELARLLSRVGDEDWPARGRAARAIYEREHRPEVVARQLVDAVASVTSGA